MRQTFKQSAVMDDAGVRIRVNAMDRSSHGVRAWPCRVHPLAHRVTYNRPKRVLRIVWYYSQGQGMGVRESITRQNQYNLVDGLRGACYLVIFG
jgi:hypothetical protein